MAKQQRRRRSDPEIERTWRERVSAWATSGLTARRYCREHGVSEASFYTWRRKLRQRDGAGTPGRGQKTSRDGAADPARTPTFLPVTVVGAPAQAQSAPIEIAHGSGATVRINSMPDAELLAAVFAALDRASSC